MIQSYTMKNKLGIEVTILNLGAIIHQIKTPDRQGKFENIIHGFKTQEAYLNNTAYFGAIIGRTAGRIKGGTYCLENKVYHMPALDRGNGLHGGKKGFHTKIWSVKASDQQVILSHISPDGDQGFPGRVKARVTYTLTDDNELIIDYKAHTDKRTLLNMTNHAYFNLNPKETVLNMNLMINSDQFLALGPDSIPTGELIDVQDTPFDFRVQKKIGRDLHLPHQQLLNAGGYDHPWLLKGDHKVVISDDLTGRRVEMTSDQPCVVLYSYNFPLEGHKKHQGLAIEFQKEPDSLNHDHFNTCVLKPGQVYRQRTLYKFMVD